MACTTVTLYPSAMATTLANPVIPEQAKDVRDMHCTVSPYLLSELGVWTVVMVVSGSVVVLIFRPFGGSGGILGEGVGGDGVDVKEFSGVEV